ncbi:PolC-type DNA polymerase III [Pseudoramibacter porci]|uniref:DNA polymerase III PolC-type n=1 Tax=Pseudoramibacter porci TaxID=2606631 RepID=A0A7X2NFB6_9FIRM|nr:PolC-type DNA polymerase III [Pseudoramibacter porci]MSS19561.1 PolC-type DNA polymerase III [Pseudoramibacter porci]
MDELTQKQQAYQALCKKHHILSKRVEISESQCELAFVFETESESQPDAAGIQMELSTIFDFSKSVTVVLDSKKRRADQAIPDLPPVDFDALAQEMPPEMPDLPPEDFDLADAPHPEADSAHLTPVEDKKEAKEKSPAEQKVDVAQHSAPFSALDARLQQALADNREMARRAPAAANGASKEGKKTVITGPMILGKKFTVPVEKMDGIDFEDTLTHDKNRHGYEGEIFSFESRELRNEKQLLEFAVSDHTSSIACKIFAGKNAEALKDRLKNGTWVHLEGTIAYDEYAHEKLLSPKVIEEIDRPKRTDDADEKRVELHMHSQYSAMDAVSKVKKIVAQAKDFGHDIIGITDHGVVQAYPEIMKETKGTDVKVLYGLEGYLVDDGVKITTGEQDEPFDGEFVFFDLETTGFYPGRDAIIEIAAARIKNKHILDTFQTFVNPHRKIPAKITELTSITDQMVAGGLEEADALRKFLEYADGCILVAHNANFDMGFLSLAMAKYQMPNHITYMDTLAMARTLIPSIARHNLKKLASYFKIDMGHHHRAIDDAVCSAKIFVRLMGLAEERDVHTSTALNSLIDLQQVIKTERPYHVIIYAKDQEGLIDLYRLVSASHVKYFYKKPRIPKSLLDAHRAHLLIGSACEAGELYTAIKENVPKHKLDQIADFYDYFEVQPLGNNDFMVRNGDLTRDDLIQINKAIIDLGREKHKLVVATGDVHYVSPEDAPFRAILQAGQGYKDADQQPPLYYRSTAEMLKEFDYLDPEAAYELVVTNTRKVADMIGDVKPVPDGTFPPVIEGSDDEIRDSVHQRAKEIYGDPLPDIVADRIHRELKSIIGNGYSVLYLIAKKLVQHSRECGYLVGSRGSVGSSLVAMLCGITEVNSLPPHYVCPKCKHTEWFDSTKVGVGPDLPDKNCPECGTLMIKDGFDIPFETFLGFKGDKEPDIDLNFSGDNQGEAHKYTEVIFGKGKVYRAGTIATLADKTAFGYVKNYLEERGKVVSRAEMDRLIGGVAGVTRTTGQHPGGVMVVPRDREIYQFTPIQYPANEKESGTLTTHFDYHSIEGRLLKLDILGHDDPTILKMLKDMTGVDPTTIPLDDENIISLFKGTEVLKLVDDSFDIPLGTCGVPEFGTNFVRKMVLDAKPTSYADLIRISGLSHGTDVWIGNAQTLIESGQATIKDVICCRDDIMLGLISMGLAPERSFWIMEHVRKGKGLLDDEEPYMRENNVPDWYIDSCKKIKYMFPKAHAVAYVMMAFRIAYYKVYYPLAYYAAYFSIRAKEFDLRVMSSGKEAVHRKLEEIRAQGNQASNKDQQLLVSLELAWEMYCRGYRFGNVDLYKSHYKNFRVEGDALIPPLISVDGLGEVVAKNIYDEAQKKPFMSMEDMQNRAHVNKANMEKLQSFGCLTNLPESNQMSFLSMIG